MVATTDRAPAIIVAILFSLSALGGCAVGRVSAPTPGPVNTSTLSVAKAQAAQAKQQSLSALSAQHKAQAALDAQHTQLATLTRELSQATAASSYWEQQAQSRPAR